MASSEKIESFTTFRSELHIEGRRCPIHDGPLELCIDDTDYSGWSTMHRSLYDHHDNRIKWRCDHCLGYWLENYFIDQTESNRRFRVESLLLVLWCPSCGSKRVTHGCVPECCEHHVCADCGRDFNAAVQVSASGVGTPGPAETFRDRSSTGAGPFKSDSMTRTGIRRSYRTCERGCASELELVLVASPAGELEAAWCCTACERVTYEVGALRARRPGFQSEVNPGVVCPQCSSSAVRSREPDEPQGLCECVACGSVLEVSLQPTSGRR